MFAISAKPDNFQRDAAKLFPLSFMMHGPGLYAGVDGSWGKVFAELDGGLSRDVLAGLLVIGLLIVSLTIICLLIIAAIEGGDESSGFLGFEVGDNLLGLRLFEFHALEIGRSDLQGVEQETGGFPFESFFQDHLHDLANDGLDRVRILENGQGDLAGGIAGMEERIDQQGTILLMVETEILVAESG